MSDQKPYQLPPDDFSAEELATYEGEQADEAMRDTRATPDELTDDDKTENAGA